MDLAFHRTISAPDGFSELVSFDAAPGGVLTTWATAEGAALSTERMEKGPNAPSFARTRARRPFDVAVVEHGNGYDHVTVLKGIETTFCSTQKLPDGFLVVGARCSWTPKKIDQNALRFDASGQLVQQGVFGDGIGRIATTKSGATWVGYFDEGVIGNRGWGGPGPTPIGRHGINCFDQNFSLIANARDSSIVDCYAMTIDGEAVYACCYTDWAIRRLDQSGTESTWGNTVEGATILVVSGQSLALIGGYKQRDRVVTGKLGTDRFHIDNESQLTLAGDALPESIRLSSRGAELHGLADGGWYSARFQENRTKSGSDWRRSVSN